MPYRFIFFTWMLIIPIHTLCTSVALGVTNFIHQGTINLNSMMAYDRISAIVIFTLPFSMPGLVGLLLLIWAAKEFIYDHSAQFRFICIGCCFFTLLCYLLLEALLNLDFQLHEYFPLVTASVISVLIALSITKRIYYRYLKTRPGFNFFV